MVQPVALDARRVLLGITAPNREAALLTMAQALLSPSDAGSPSAERVVEAVLTREARHSSRIEGIAFPHTRVVGLTGTRVCLATLAQPIAWGDETVGTIVLMLGSPQRPGALLQLARRAGQSLSGPEARKALDEARDPAALDTWFEARVTSEEAPILAEEVMRPAGTAAVRPDLALTELVERMAIRGVDVVWVTDEKQRLLGQVKADDLLTLGVPDFFRQLRSVSFIAEFDPFERYFERESRLTVEDVMNREMAIVPPDATMLEVVFLLSVKQHPQVYVVDDERRLLGVIDRSLMLNRIFNL